MSVDPFVVTFGVFLSGAGTLGMLAPVRLHRLWFRLHPLYERPPGLTELGRRTERAIWAVVVFAGAAFVVAGLR